MMTVVENRRELCRIFAARTLARLRIALQVSGRARSRMRTEETTDASLAYFSIDFRVSIFSHPI